MDYLAQNWLLTLIALVAALLVAWYVFHASRRTRVTGERRDVLDEGAAPAARNQALIDSSPAASRDIPLPPITPEGLAGVGEAVSAAVGSEQIQASEAAASDDLSRIKGLGPKLVAQLEAMGITRFDQIAGWSEAEIDEVDSQLGRFQGRIRRDNWVEQARFLAADDSEGFTHRFGKLN